MKHLRITVEGKSYNVEVELLDEDAEASVPETVSTRGIQSSAASMTPLDVKQSMPSGQEAEVAIVSPLSAVVVSVDVAAGDTVEEGQKVVTLEAMKMNTIVQATAAGIVKNILVSVGDSVEEGQPLVKLG